MLVFVEGGKRIQGKPSEQGENQHPGWHETLAALVGGEQSHHWVIPTPSLALEGLLIVIGALIKKRHEKDYLTERGHLLERGC